MSHVTCRSIGALPSLQDAALPLQVPVMQSCLRQDGVVAFTCFCPHLTLLELEVYCCCSAPSDQRDMSLAIARFYFDHQRR